MKTFKEICEEYGIEEFDCVFAKVTKATKNGSAATIDGTDGRLEIFYKGSQKQGEKVLLSVSRIDEEARKIFGRCDSYCDYDFAA